MADITGITNLTSSSNGATSLTGIQAAATNLNNAKAEIGGQVFSGSISATNLSGTNTGDQTLPIDSTMTVTDNTSNNVSTSAHGFAPKAPNDATKFLNGTGAYAKPKDSDLAVTDVTTNNVTTSAHGFVPKAPNTGIQFLRDDASWATLSNLIAGSAANSGTSIPGTSTYTSFLTVTIPANVLGSSGIVVARLRINCPLMDASSAALPFKILYGGNALSTFTATGAASGTFDGWLEIILQANGATNAQNIMGSLLAQVAAANTGGYYLASGYINGTTATDSTSNQNLVVQTQSTNGSQTVNVRGYTVTKL